MDKDTEPHSTDDLRSSGLTDKGGHKGTQGEQDSDGTVELIHSKPDATPDNMTADQLDSSSEGEDLAKLEELNRMKAQLEAKLRAKKLRKKTTTTTTQQPSDDASATGGNTGDSTPSRSVNRCDPIMIPKPEVVISSSGGPPSDSPSDMTTPTTSTTPLISPGFRTPSPPHRSRFMSPPSGASSRKRQHSPSPLPKASLIPTHHTRYGSLTPTPKRHLRYTGGAKTPEKASSFHDKMKQEMDDKNWSEEYDLLDEELDGDLLDELLGDDFDQVGSEGTSAETTKSLGAGDSQGKETAAEEGSTGVSTVETGEDGGERHGATNLTLTEIVESQRQKREAEKAMLKAPKTTFYTIAADSGTLSTTESTQVRHTLDIDPLTGLRIRDRVLSCEEVFTMTNNLSVIPLKENEQIQEKSNQRSSKGLLHPPSGGRLGGGAGSTESEPKPDNWILAGVVGAKSKQRMTAKKDRYCHFQISDLRNSSVNIFMFRSVMDKHYDKLEVGSIVVVLNPRVLPQAERSGTLGVEVEHPDCLLVIGTSTDFGLCEAVKLNGENCGKIMDKRGSVYCNYHIMMATNKHRNQRGSLIAGTSSVYDLEGGPSQAGSATMPRKIGAGRQTNTHPERQRALAQEPTETTYIFRDGGVGSSSMVDHDDSKKGSQKADGGLSTFLMSQNNPGGQYLRQAKTSKDVAWAKDITSPKTPTSSTELFPAEMIRRMGYDPVRGKFVPGSPKRTNDDLEARERSIRLLAERVRSPPAPMQPLSGLSPARRRTIEVKGTTRSIAQPRSSKSAAKGEGVQGNVFLASPKPPGSPSASQKWVNLDEGSSDDDRGSPLLSLSHQRAKLLQETRAKRSHLLSPGAATSTTMTTPKPATKDTTSESSTTTSQRKPMVPTAMMILKRKPTTTINPLIPSTAATSGSDKAPSIRPDSDPKANAVSSGADTLLHAPEAPATPDEGVGKKKPKYIEFSDSE
ncbi:hypothetical protein B0O80DRAFT_203756 [Mortierella sp. GBAus27b]|nr:hypothetical protein BGX31_006650 [Mortierella sp. GBA43]KAI8360419.1 hypothetical protein B0O80DRAFT_203756 [Mortierella sp. GBAus27b]